MKKISLYFPHVEAGDGDGDCCYAFHNVGDRGSRDKKACLSFVSRGYNENVLFHKILILSWLACSFTMTLCCLWIGCRTSVIFRHTRARGLRYKKKVETFLLNEKHGKRGKVNLWKCYVITATEINSHSLLSFCPLPSRFLILLCEVKD